MSGGDPPRDEQDTTPLSGGNLPEADARKDRAQALQRLGDFELLREIGRGGMGVVYEARQLSLDRRVAVKLLTEESFGDERLRARFLREARTAAALNHPGICTVHEVGEVRSGEESTLADGVRLAAGTPFISMELIEGSTLAARLRQSGSLPLDELLRIALDVADGLAEAHAKGIVHRDLKPQNVMLTRGGRAKILDFGLAKPTRPTPEKDAILAAAETVSAELTREGRVLGTVAYMSPEQAQGRSVDSRSDVFSFGIMLYEMATGRRPFRGESPTSTLAKILEAEPEPVNVLRSDLPPELVRIVQRCLRKRPEDRYNDTRDLVVALKDLRGETTSGATARSGRARGGNRKAAWVRGFVVAAAAVALAAIVAWYAFRSPKPVAPETVHRQITFVGNASQPAISDDGRTVAYVTKDENNDVERVWVQDLAGGEPLEIFRGHAIMELLWSPRGGELLLGADTEEEGYHAQIVPRLGGTPRRHRVFFPSALSWAPDGTRFAHASILGESIRFTDVKTGRTESIALQKSFEWLGDLEWAPSGEWLAFLATDKAGRYAIWTIRPDGTMQQKVLEREMIGDVAWHPKRDAILYQEIRGQTLGLGMIAIDPRTGSRVGDPKAVLPGVEVGSFSISADGRHLVYTRGNAFRNLWLVDFEGEPPNGRAEVTQLTSGTRINWYPSFSPDGLSIAFNRGRGMKGEIFVLPLEGGSPRQLTFLDSVSWSPAWSPDGTEIAFFSMAGQTGSIWRVAVAGGTPKPYEGTEVGSEVVWAPGAKILHTKMDNANLFLLDVETEADTPLLPDGSGWIAWARYSQDGKRIAFMWNRTSGDDAIRGQGIWVLSLEDSSELLVCKGSSTVVGWSADDEWIYAVAGELDEKTGEIVGPKMIRIPASGGEPEPWFDIPFERVSNTGLDITPDGRRFVGNYVELVSDIWIAENFDTDPR